jgi:hypothetical protein
MRKFRAGNKDGKKNGYLTCSFKMHTVKWSLAVRIFRERANIGPNAIALSCVRYRYTAKAGCYNGSIKSRHHGHVSVRSFVVVCLI